MITRTPRIAAVDAYSASAGSMASRSDSEPMTMPTSGPGASSSSSRPNGASWTPGSARNVHRLRGDVVPVARARERDSLAGVVRACPRLLERLAQPGHGQNSAAARDEPPVSGGRARVEDERPLGFGRLDPLDRRARVAGLRVALRCEDDGDGGRAGRDELDHAQVAGRRGGERLDEIALEPRQEIGRAHV